MVSFIGLFAKETYNFKEPTNRSHPICMKQHPHSYVCHNTLIHAHDIVLLACCERWGAGVETQKNVLGVFGGWGRVPFNESYAPLFSTIYDGA